MEAGSSEPRGLALFGYSQRSRGGGCCDAASGLVGTLMCSIDMGHDL